MMINPQAKAQFGADLDRIVVDRQGEHPAAFMTTVGVSGMVDGLGTYVIGSQGIQSVEAQTIEPQAVVPRQPPQVVFQGRWLSAAEGAESGNNILGQNGRLEVDALRLEIPEAKATPEHLAYYGAKLVAFGEPFQFETAEPMPTTTMAIGSHYVDGFITDQEKGGGVYLEHHNLPHFHMPLNDDASGHLILGKRSESGLFEVSAFPIPYGFGIYTGPEVLHDDAFLVGDYEVVYGLAPEFSTVTLYQSQSSTYLPVSVCQ